MNSPDTSGAQPRVSLIMPVRNEADFIGRCLDAVVGQEYPAGLLEIIIADGMSDDGTREIIGRYQQRHSNIFLVDNPERIAATALNRAIRRSSGEIIIRVDGHCEIAPDYVRKCVAHLQKNGVDGVGGPITTVGQTPVAQAIAAAMSSKFGVGDSGFRVLKDETRFVDTIAFPAYTRDLIERAGLYDEELVRNQDDEYNYRLRSSGARLLLAADVRSTYYSRSSLRSLWRQYFQYGFWKVRVMQKLPGQMQLRQFVPPLFVGTLLAGVAMMPFSFLGMIVFGIPFGLYLAANLIASIMTGAGLGWRVAGLLPIVFAILHMSYGAGFLTGLFRFVNRWGDRVGRVPERRELQASLETK
ncbi:MAG: glycosyltransferase [Bacteroidetes bacterium]|nr:glycosyltransferase [Bacteroidota bacterium]MCW5897461.1 glycosyltransferase [Bacteroidota bacterium]